jgi:hypothetical protein
MSDPVTGATEANGLATSSTCAGCGAPLAPDQRYCLACGRPASPVRLAFLDVLQGEYQPTGAGGAPLIPGGPVSGGYPPPPEPDGLLGALRRYSGLLSLVGVLLASLLIGLLVGHWITGGSGGSGAVGKQVIEVKGLSGLQAVAPAAGSTTSSGSGSSSSSGKASSTSASHSSPQSEKAEEAKEAKEVKAVKAPPPVKKTTNSGALKKLSETTGKQHEKEASKLINGDEPIETH